MDEISIKLYKIMSTQWHVFEVHMICDACICIVFLHSKNAI